METVRKIQSIRSILFRMAQEIRKALKTKEPNQKIISMLEHGNKELTKILPQIRHMFVPRMVTDVISRSQKIIGMMSASPNSGRNEVNKFIENGMHDYYFSHLEKMYLKSKKRGNLRMFFGYCIVNLFNKNMTVVNLHKT